MTMRLPAFATIPQWCELTGMGRAMTYDLLSKGHLRAQKLGRRTVIDVQHGLKYIRSQPKAEIRLKRAPREVIAHVYRMPRRRAAIRLGAMLGIEAVRHG